VKTCLIFNPYKAREVKNGEASSRALRSIFGSWPPHYRGFETIFYEENMSAPCPTPHQAARLYLFKIRRRWESKVSAAVPTYKITGEQDGKPRMQW
jgi:hypothetical protein